MSRWLRSEAFKKRQTPMARRTGKPRRKMAERETGMRLQAVERTVPADLDLLSPTMRVVVIEDLCWAMEREAWLDRRPAWWQFAARHAWAAEAAALDAKQQRVRELASAD